jgi:hypothetical protein
MSPRKDLCAWILIGMFCKLLCSMVINELIVDGCLIAAVSLVLKAWIGAYLMQKKVTLAILDILSFFERIGYGKLRLQMKVGFSALTR